jgi:pilus assembly protein FimV
MNQLAKKLLLRTVAAVGCMWIALAAHAVGLSGIQVKSGLGQPLLAQIEVNALEPDEFARVNARVAGPDEYAAAKLAYSPLLRQIRINAERSKDGKLILNITSVAPINEPTLELLVDFNWRGGKLLQKYAVLLDPTK